MKKERYGNAKGGFTKVFCTYRNSAKKRGHSFEFTKEQFRDLTKQNCWYCGIKPSQIAYDGSKMKGYMRGFYFYNGIDRMDNNQGYTEANCIPCCSRCNRMKMASSGEDFISQIRKIAVNLNLIR